MRMSVSSGEEAGICSVPLSKVVGTLQEVGRECREKSLFIVGSEERISSSEEITESQSLSLEAKIIV